MNYSLNSSRLSRLDSGVELLSSRVVYNTADAGDVCRLLEGIISFVGGGANGKARRCSRLVVRLNTLVRS